MKQPLSNEELYMRQNIINLVVSGERDNAELAYQLLLSINLKIEDLFDNNQQFCDFANTYLKAYHRDIWVPRFFIDNNTGYKTLDYSFSDTTPSDEYPFITPMVEQLITHLYGIFAEEQPSIIFECPNLKSLHVDVDEFVFRDFPSKILDLIQLEHLYLKYYEVANIPSQITKLVNLKSFSLKASHLFQIPESIKELPALENVTIFTNKTRPKDEDFERYNIQFQSSLLNLSQCPNLKQLELTISDGVQHLQTLGKMQKLEKLILNIPSYLIESLPAILLQLKYLDEVQLKINNKHTAVDVNKFEKAVGLLRKQYNFSCV